MTQTDSDVLVIGAGVIGLTTAICLAEAGVSTAVIAAEPPQQTTSAAAGAHLGTAPGGHGRPGGALGGRHAGAVR